MNDGGNNGAGDGRGGGIPPGLHFLKALGHAALAIGHVTLAPEEPDQTEAPRRRRKRYTFSTPSAGRAEKGSCCRAKR